MIFERCDKNYKIIYFRVTFNPRESARCCTRIYALFIRLAERPRRGAIGVKLVRVLFIWRAGGRAA